MDINPNAYYNYRKHRKNAKQTQKAFVMNTIKTIYHDTGGKPGYRMMQQLLANKGIQLSPHTVHNYMKELRLKSITRKAKYHYSKGTEAYSVFENLLEQQFQAEKRNSKWCVDFTYIYFADHRKRYNCSIIDLYDRRVVSSVCSNRINSKLAIETLSKALKSIGGETGMILHSDRGSQFTSREFVEFCKDHGIIQSMSKPGCPYDNAPMERYFNTLKAELINIHNYQTEAQLYEEVAAYAYGWYNNLRPHSFNGGIPPAKVA